MPPIKQTKIADDKDEILNKLVDSEFFALQALDGFLMVLSAEGDVTYVTETISEHLGIAKIDLMGQPIWDYSHQCDHEELKEALNGKKSPSEMNGSNGDASPLVHRDFMLRLKCTLTSRGRSVNIKSASYKVNLSLFKYL